MITIITGMGRCGSSLTMQMLHAAGVECVGNGPFFEDERSSFSKFDADWLADQEGKAVKVLGIHQVKMKPANYRFIVLKRNPNEQAKSQTKFYETVIKQKSDASQKGLKSQVKKHYARCLNKARLKGPVLELDFEDMINNPVYAIAKICQFMDLKPTECGQKMLECVIKRNTDCLPTMQIESVLSDPQSHPARL